jgi:hypothetical protein
MSLDCPPWGRKVPGLTLTDRWPCIGHRKVYRWASPKLTAAAEEPIFNIETARSNR